MSDITELAQRNELLIANGQQTADLLRHLADNEIDSDYFAVVSECESYGKETDAELSITEFALRAAGYVDALVEALEKAQQRISELTSENAALKGRVENAAGCINAAYFEGLSDVLAESSDDRLVDLVKRRLLFAYLPVETPATNEEIIAMGDWVLREQLEDGTRAIKLLNQRIAELESRTVKLPDLRQIVSGDRYVWSDGVYNYSQDVKAALTAAGIKVEAE